MSCKYNMIPINKTYRFYLRNKYRTLQQHRRKNLFRKLQYNNSVVSGHKIGVLSDRSIREEILAGNIVLHDPERSCIGNIQNCSVDITLGRYYYRNNKILDVFNPWDKKQVEQYWGNVKIADIVTSENANSLNLKVGESYILLNPGESILGHTREFVGGRNFITTMIKARSSLGRNNITICRDAGWGDIGFVNRWCLEITNNGSSPMILPIGSRIGQIIFFYTGYSDTEYTGKYQISNDIEDIVSSWNPEMLLPKLYKDNL